MNEEWDMVQGSYKDEFYDKFLMGVEFILCFGCLGVGQKYYDNYMSFMLIVLLLGISCLEWLGNVYYDLKNEGLMFNQFNLVVFFNIYGYFSLGCLLDYY